jgi:hypothetical protein
MRTKTGYLEMMEQNSVSLWYVLPHSGRWHCPAMEMAREGG